MDCAKLIEDEKRRRALNIKIIVLSGIFMVPKRTG